MGPRVLYPFDLCPILKNLSIQHISGYNLIQDAIGCSVASPLRAAKSGMKRDYMRNTMSRRKARVALSTSPHPRMLCKESYHVQNTTGEKCIKRKGPHKHVIQWLKRRKKRRRGDREKVEEKMGVTVSNTYIYMGRLRLNNERVIAVANVRLQMWINSASRSWVVLVDIRVYLGIMSWRSD